jgi:hypothetical protein
VPEPEGSLVQVKPGAKRYFYTGNEKPGCPALTTACRRRAYVVPGDQLVAEEARGDFMRVTYVAPGKSDSTDGWIETAALRTIALPAPRLESWLGSWSYWDNHINIEPGSKRGTLKISGTALWGGRDPERVARGSVHVGEIDDDALVPSGDRLEYDDGERCQASMHLLGPYLVVVDNAQCGGLNVDFSGAYRR